MLVGYSTNDAVMSLSLGESRTATDLMTCPGSAAAAEQLGAALGSRAARSSLQQKEAAWWPTEAAAGVAAVAAINSGAAITTADKRPKGHKVIHCKITKKSCPNKEQFLKMI